MCPYYAGRAIDLVLSAQRADAAVAAAAATAAAASVASSVTEGGGGSEKETGSNPVEAGACRAPPADYTDVESTPTSTPEECGDRGGVGVGLEVGS